MTFEPRGSFVGLTLFTVRKMATGGVGSVPLASSAVQQGVIGQVPPQHGGPSAPSHAGGGGDASVFPEGGKVRDLTLQLHGALVQAQQLKLASAQQQQQPSIAVSQQVRQHCSFWCVFDGRYLPCR